MGIPLSRVLLDFGAVQSVLPPAGDGPPGAAAAIHDQAEAVFGKLDEAYARGVASGRAAAEAEHQQRLAEAIARAAEQHAAERALLVSGQAEQLAARLSSAVETSEARIADTVGHILTPFLSAELRNKSVEALAESIGTLLSGGNAVSLRISGPDDLLAALRERLGASPAAIDWQPGDRADVTVCADDSVIETEIQSWLDRVAGAHR
jgi:flagellar biosynthesis/type III secretory pathway protein FliH